VFLALFALAFVRRRCGVCVARVTIASTVSSLGIAPSKSIAVGSQWASANGNVPLRGTDSRAVALITAARVLTHVVDAGAIVGTLAVGDALATLTTVQGVADVTGQTGAHRPLLAEVVVARSALGVNTAGIWIAEILRLKWSAVFEWISSHVPWTTADCPNSVYFTVGVSTTRTFTWVYAPLTQTSPLT